MAYGTFLHLERELPYQPSTVDWLGPRVSFSTDFGPASIGTKKEASEDGSPARISGKHSPSEFEFSMSFQGQDRYCGRSMLSADELFYEGKLLPLYAPQHLDVATGIALGTTKSVECVKAKTNADRETEDSIPSGPLFSVSTKIDSCPVSPKAPTCTSRWRELFGMKKTLTHEVKDVHTCKQQLKASPQNKHSYVTDIFLAPARSSDAGKEPNVNSRRTETHGYSAGLLQDECAPSYHFRFPPEPFPSSEPGLTHFHNWQADKAMSGSRSSKRSDDSEGIDKFPNPQKTESAMVKQRNSTSSPTKDPAKILDLRNAGTSPRRGARGVSLGGASVGSRRTESSENTTSAKKAVRSLDRAYSNPKGLRKKSEQVKSGRQSSGLERSTSYPASVRVSPVINVPLYITPVLRKGSKNGIFGLSQFFSSKKEKTSKPNIRATS